MTKINNKKLFNLITSIPRVANKEKWILTLDREERALFYAPKIIPNKSELHQLTDEYAVYTDKEFNPKGLVIDYYEVNFIKHHPEFKEITREVFGEDKRKIKTVDCKNNKKKKKAIVLKVLLERTLASEAIGGSLIINNN
ncbi:MAG: hypothetical protein U9P63_03335 [Patescibacteria group bacterium]|nr:hypothetical protein [Patescibacteria group bacterium]